MTKYKGKWAVITGAGDVIGKALSNKCMGLGINVVLIDMSTQPLLSIKSQLSSQYPSVYALHYPCDISNEHHIKTMITRFKNDYYSLEEFKNKPIIIHFLFNNAGISSFTNVLNGDLKTMHKTMDINLFGMIYITQSFLPFLQTKSPLLDNITDDRYIINTSSMSGVGTADSFHAVTKHGVSALTQIFQCELKTYNEECTKQRNGRGIIYVSCLIPSYVHSSFFESTDTVETIRNVSNGLNKIKTYNSGRCHPELWEDHGIDPSIVADIVFKEGIEMKHFWIHTHKDWSNCILIDKYYSIYTKRFNQYTETKKMLNKYQQNLQRIIDKKSKL